MTRRTNRPNEFKATALFHKSRHLRVAAGDLHTVAVTVTGHGNLSNIETVTVDADVLDFIRVIRAATDPSFTIDVTVRGADGNIRVQSYGSECTFRSRSYKNGGQATVDIDMDKIKRLGRFLEPLASSHPLSDVGETVVRAISDGYEATGVGWTRNRLSVTPTGNRLVVRAEQTGRERGRVERVTVPLSSFGNMVRLAGGDIPGDGLFDTVPGSLSFEHNRRAALQLSVRTDQVDGTSVFVCLDLEQVQELRSLIPAWQKGSI